MANKCDVIKSLKGLRNVPSLVIVLESKCSVQEENLGPKMVVVKNKLLTNFVFKHVVSYSETCILFEEFYFFRNIL